MKSTITILLLSVVLFSCTKQTKDYNVQQVLAEKNVKTQKQMYYGLSPEEKYNVWEIKFKNFLSNDNLTSDQRKFVNFVMQDISPATFSNTEPEDDPYTKEAIRLFNPKNAFQLLASLDGEYTDLTGENYDCNCAKHSDYCNDDLKCSYADCKKSELGCGTLLLYSCNGLCK